MGMSATGCTNVAKKLQMTADRLHICCKWQHKCCNYVANVSRKVATRLHICCTWQQQGCKHVAHGSKKMLQIGCRKVAYDNKKVANRLHMTARKLHIICK